MTHDEAMTLLPDYALGALDDADALDAHLGGCPICTAELASYLEMTAALAEAVAPATLPASLRGRVLAHVTASPEGQDDRDDWVAAGRFSLDQSGYGRLILPGGDGSDITTIEVTRQPGATRTPTGTIVLQGP